MWPTFISLWLALSGKTPQRRAPCRRPASRRPASRPRLEALEDRCLLSAGALDPTFGNGAGYVTTSVSNGDNGASAALIQPDGKILAAGTANFVNVKKNSLTDQDFAVVRYNTNGSLDTSFGNGGTALANFGSVNALSNPTVKNPSVHVASSAAALYPQAGTVNDGKIVLAGLKDSWWWSGQVSIQQDSFALARFNANGTLDSTFGNQGEVTTFLATLGHSGGVVIQPDGKIVVAGGTATGFALARYNINGTLDTTFGSGGEVVTSLGQWVSYASALLLQPDGKLIVSGDMDPASGGHFWELARYNPNGSLDTSFGNGGIVSGTFGAGADAYGAALYPSGTANAGKIVVVGVSSNGANGNWGIARYNPDGTLDSTFGTGGEVITTTGGYGYASSVAIAADGKLVVTGNYNNSGFAMARYNTDGSLDSTFGTGGIVTTPTGTKSRAYAVVLQPNGNIVVAGESYNGSKWNFAVARYLPSEPQIGSFTASPNPVTAGSSVMLTASNLTDGNPNSTITQVAFYVDSNGDGILEPGTDTLLGYGTQSTGTWTLTFSTTDWAAAIDTLFAQAKDNYGVFGDPFPTSLQVL